MGESFDRVRLMGLGLPWRLMHEEPADVPGKDAIDSPEKMDRLLDEYYALHGWDRETSWPTRETLELLDLADYKEGIARLSCHYLGPEANSVSETFRLRRIGAVRRLAGLWTSMIDSA